MADEATTYPIRIDPTIEINYDNNEENGIQDVTINSAKGSSGSSGSLFVGKRATYGISRTLMRFPELGLSEIPSAPCITNATVEIRDIMCEAAELQVYCYLYTGGIWYESTANWSNVSPNSYATLLSSNTVSYNNGVGKTAKHRYSFDITAAVKAWKIGNYSAFNGIIFKASSSVENGTTNISKTFASYNRSSNKPSLTVTYKDTYEQTIADGSYSINNLYFGKYLSSSVTAVSGAAGSLGRTIEWDILKVDNGYVIRSRASSSKFLGVSSTGSTVEAVTVSNAPVPLRCVWDIIEVGDGGYYIESAYNSMYLYYGGSSIGMLFSTGPSGSIQQKSCIWRIVKSVDMANRGLAEFSTDLMNVT